MVRGDNVTIGSLRWDAGKLKCWNEPFSRAKEYSLQEGDIVIGMDGSRVGQNRAQIKSCDLPLLLAQRVACVRHNERTLQDFLYYLIFNDRFVDYVKLVQTGTSIPHISLKQIGAFEVDVPSISTQKRICAILKSIDDKIILNNRINHNLEEQAKSLYKSWFVDFEPFKDGRFVDSEIGKIPEGWRIYSLPEIASIESGYSYKGSELVSSTTAMATIKNFDRNGSFKIDGFKEIHPGPKVRIEHYINLFDVLVAHTDITQKAEIIGNPAIILSKAGYESIIMSMDLCKVTARERRISQGLIYHILKSDLFKNHALGYVNGTTVLHLSKKALTEYKVALPSDLRVIEEISSSLLNMCKLQASICDENQELSVMRDILLPRLVSGKAAFIDC